jgi:spermidine synthase
MPKAWQRFLSYLWPWPIETAYSPQAGRLEVRLEGGQKVLNGPRANYSYGRLQQVWKEALGYFGWRPQGEAPLLLLGFGAGSWVPVLQRRGPLPPLHAVENDPAVLRLGKRHFPENFKAVYCFEQEALAFLASGQMCYQALFIDLFIDVTVPPAFREEVFPERVYQRLLPGGWAFHNVMLPLKREKALMAFYEDRFGAVRTFRKYGQNLVLAVQKPY